MQTDEANEPEGNSDPAQPAPAAPAQPITTSDKETSAATAVFGNKYAKELEQMQPPAGTVLNLLVFLSCNIIYIAACKHIASAERKNPAEVEHTPSPAGQTLRSGASLDDHFTGVWSSSAAPAAQGMAQMSNLSQPEAPPAPSAVPSLRDSPAFSSSNGIGEMNAASGREPLSQHSSDADLVRRREELPTVNTQPEPAWTPDSSTPRSGQQTPSVTLPTSIESPLPSPFPGGATDHRRLKGSLSIVDGTWIAK